MVPPPPAEPPPPKTDTCPSIFVDKTTCLTGSAASPLQGASVHNIFASPNPDRVRLPVVTRDIFAAEDPRRDDCGFDRARHLFFNPIPPRRLPPPSASGKSTTEPFPLPGHAHPTDQEVQAIREEMSAFRRVLPEEQRLAFDARLRLTQEELDAQLSRLPPEAITRRGLRPSWRSGRPPPDVPSSPTERFQAWAILMDAWHYVDPLQLHMYADMRRFGMCLATNVDIAELPPAGRQRPANLPSATSRHLKEIVRRKMLEDAHKGKCVGPLSVDELRAVHPKCFTVPLGLARKDNGEPSTAPSAWRLVKSWSRPFKGGLSISDRTDRVKTMFTRPSRVRRAVHEAFCNKSPTSLSHVLAIDFEDAFAQNWLAPDQRCYMVSFIQGMGYFVRHKGDFGMKTCGYRFELLGLLASSMYKIMEKRVFVHDDGRVWLATTHSPPHKPPPDDMAGSLERDSCDLTPTAQAALLVDYQPHTPPTGYHPVRLSGFLRWVDDLVAMFDSKAEAVRALHAIAFLHRRYGWKIKPSKVRLAPRLPFNGALLNPAFGCMEIPAEKRLKYEGVLGPIAAGQAMTPDELESATGVAGWISGILPQLVPFANIFYRSLYSLKKVSRFMPPPSLVRAAAVFVESLKRAPRQLASLERSFGMNEAQEIIHGDWAGQNRSKNLPHRIAVVLVSRGWYAYMDVPSWVMEARGPLCPNSGETLCIALAAATFGSVLTGKKAAFCSDSSGLILRSPYFQAGPSGSRAIDGAFELAAFALVESNTCFSYIKIPRNRNLADPIVNSNGSLRELQRKWSSAGLPGKPSPVKPRFPTRPSYWRPQ